jgi:pimeloyl-ACP methyl ester carboxylesterase
LLFVHGIFADGRVAESMMGFFAARGHPCWAINLRGRSGSRPGTVLGRASLRDFATDVMELAHHIGRPVIIGHSMGGLVAQLAGAQQAATALVLLAPAPPRGIPLLNWRLAISQIPYLPDVLLSRQIDPDPGPLSRIAFNKVPESAVPDLLAQVVPDSGRAGREMTITGMPVQRSRLNVPMLVISGDDDRFIPLRVVRHIAARYGAPLRIARGRGHMLILEPGWEEIATWISEWLDTLHIPPTPNPNRETSE